MGTFPLSCFGDILIKFRHAPKHSLPTEFNFGYIFPRMLAVESKSSTVESSTNRPLALESREFMHFRELLRRYERMPWMKKTELMDGVVYLGSSLTSLHGRVDGLVQAWLATYASRQGAFLSTGRAFSDSMILKR